MFQHLKNIDTAFKHVRLFSCVLIISTMLTCGYCVFWVVQYTREVQQRVYILANGKALEAVSSGRMENLGIEARDHVKTFHELFFNLLPDEQYNDRRIQQSLYLADRSAKQQYDNLKEAGYFSQVVGANISQEVITDSIVIDQSIQPFYFRFYGKQRIRRPTATVLRSLVTEGYLRDLRERTDNNPHAFLIERWSILQNIDLEKK